MGYSIWNMLLGRYPAGMVAPFALLAPPVGLVAAALVLGQVPNPVEAVGAVVLVGGVALGQLRRRRASSSTAPDLQARPSRQPRGATAAGDRRCRDG